ncbi:unnamed protein product [Mesocestoides corti]|uniref:Glucosidase 2 subunit beta n=1 Tax=Mesocestoides corti TaxID=53468 RepID=A0A3P6GR54_MESCO|nr:unnamed protein product [Mesocestoides corti]
MDKSATIPWSKVNDDYCDCVDGSDEPGTSACPDMEFYCSNIGHEGAFIHSSFVNDMVCDCCDGSDEYLGLVKCENTCGTLAKEKEEKLDKRRKDFESGHEIYRAYIAKKAVEIEEAKRHAEEANELVQDPESLPTVSESEKEHAEAEEPKIETEPEPLPHFPDFDGFDRHEKPEEEQAEPAPLDEPSQGDAAKGSENAWDASNEGSEEELTPDDHDAEESDSELDKDIPPAESHETEEHYQVPVVSKPIDYGPDNGFMMLTEPETGCLEFRDNEYVYSLCAFKDVRQRVPHASSGGTLLGTWKEWVGHPEDSVNWTREEKLAKLPYSEMLYDAGEYCWNGPNRSVKVTFLLLFWLWSMLANVKVACGPENKLVSAEEPSRCTYVMKLETPAACHHEPLKLMEMHTEL